MQICSFARIKVLNIIYKENTSPCTQILFTLFTCRHVMINTDVKKKRNADLVSTGN